MDKISVKFNKEGVGPWADGPADPIFEVKEGEVVEVSLALAKTVEAASKGRIVQTEADEVPKDDTECKLANGKDGVIEDGVCVKGKKGFNS